jgi:hypothetical protein
MPKLELADLDLEGLFERWIQKEGQDPAVLQHIEQGKHKQVFLAQDF